MINILEKIVNTGNFEYVESKDGLVISIGVARLYYETGMPLAASYNFAEQNNFKISWLNVADQFKKQGFSNQRIISEFRELLGFSPDCEADLEQIALFLSLDYAAQREMLWEYWGKILLSED